MTPERLAEIRAWSQKGNDCCPSVVHVRELLEALKVAGAEIDRLRIRFKMPCGMTVTECQMSGGCEGRVCE